MPYVNQYKWMVYPRQLHGILPIIDYNKISPTHQDKQTSHVNIIIVLRHKFGYKYIQLIDDILNSP